MRIIEGLVKISVRELVEFTLRQGSIRSSGAPTGNRAVIGTLAHKKIQNSMEANYEAEVKMVHECALDDIEYIIEGRADGIIKDLVSVTIDEIKTTTVPLDQIEEDFNPLHWAQAKCYAYFYAKDHKMKSMQVRLTYYNIDTKEIKHLERGFYFDELESFFGQIIKKYHKWITFYMKWTKERNASLVELTFPFDKYRKGQREVAISVYKAIKGEEKLFINAPTGIGKTISTLFPTLKAMGEGSGSKIFYLTAKTITRTVAEEGIQRLQNNGARIKSITITAKDKICFCEKRECHPDFCQWAEGYYDRIDEASYEILQKEDTLTRPIIEMYARKYQLCPFELALDLAVWADVIICDYNYVFDPNVGLKRFADNKDFIILVDEAHNLVDRAREMYSAGLSKRQVLNVKKILGKGHSSISKELKRINDYLLELRKTYIDEVGVYITKEPPKELYKHIRRFLAACDKKLTQKGVELPQELMDFYFEAYNFNRTYELFDEHYICYAEEKGSEVYVKQFCMDPSMAIDEITSGCKSVVFFSATLLPISYFKEMLGGAEEKALNFESPFLEEHALRCMTSDVSTRYRDRQASIGMICRYIEQIASKKQGHYMVFFPSYKYMEETYEAFKEETQYKIYKQENEMTEEDREAFLKHFEIQGETTINFCVLGGIFSEGIDLTGERLIGVIVVGVGLPQIGLERDLIKNYFNETGRDGYHYAYTYPGINKVLQAVGRLIRTEEDKGVIVLIDDRYLSYFYQEMLPYSYQRVNNSREIEQVVKDFWKQW